MSDQTSRATTEGLGADVTTDEQARVEQAAEVAGAAGPLQSVRRNLVLSVLLRNIGLVIVLLLLASATSPRTALTVAGLLILTSPELLLARPNAHCA